MSKKTAVGANVLFCGHRGYFLGDISEVGGALVISTDPSAADPANLIRDDRYGPPTHHLLDFPNPVYWRPDKGVFVVPERNVKVL